MTAVDTDERTVLVVSGSRSLERRPNAVIEAFRAGLDELSELGVQVDGALLLHGAAPGVDRIIARWVNRARWRGLTVEAVPANWRPNGTFDRAAGHKRNAKMVARAHAMVAVWDGRSRGTAGAVKFAERKGMPVVVQRLTPEA